MALTETRKNVDAIADALADAQIDEKAAGVVLQADCELLVSHCGRILAFKYGPHFVECGV